jgi:hypothetical protein
MNDDIMKLKQFSMGTNANLVSQNSLKIKKKRKRKSKNKDKPPSKEIEKEN